VSVALLAHPVLASVPFWMFVAGLVWLALIALWPQKRTSLELKITPCDDLRHNDYMGPGGRDIFGRVRIELLEPAKVKVKGYSAIFTRNGVPENVEILNDADKQLLIDLESPTPRNDPVSPLPKKLQSGHPIEAWYHFKTTKNQYQIESGRLDFTVDTALGGRSEEIPLTHEQWNRDHQNLIMPRG
jgi:hypothetical protein